ncbi:tRNA pseudouridine13 synthase [Trypanosoma grayi]|uniref:tRNA pseudouridine13 synthase n=1 Tax=Trypanosoma grayi TaxID=71804 RepID=UPI0004F4393C|nr:tRNA pseudouridine13 synthase [Trypanosoma grayi]KEG13835.1 tRNA pseudouridine13 synthase [Trypanosoma grayi]
MKVAARGPIVRWSLRRPTTGIAVSRSDWRSGRDLSTEEKDSGLLLRLRDVCAKVPDGSRLPVAVVKAHSSDFQVNEIDAGGNVATLEKAPKGRWQKISRQKTLLVEDNRETPFSNPLKTFSPRVQSYGEYVRSLGRLPRDFSILRFVLYRDSHSISSVVNRVGYVLSPQQDCMFMHHQPGGSFGCITQYGVCIGMTKELLPHASRHYNLHPLIFDPREYHSNERLDSLLQRPCGHYYRMTLRCVEGDRDFVNSRLKFISERGFINYFGLDTFGVGTNRFFEMASFAAQGDYLKAVGGLLQCIAECDGVHHDYYLRYLNAEPSTVPGVSKSWADAAKHMRSQKWLVELLQQLSEYHEGAVRKDEHLRKIWERVPVRDRIQRSAAEFVWNAMTSQRLLSKGLEVVEGDVVRVRTSDSSSVIDTTSFPKSSYDYKHVTGEDARRGVYNIQDVVLPIPYDSVSLRDCLFPELTPLDREFYQEFAAKHGLSFLFEETFVPGATPRELYRPLVVKPRDFQVVVIHDPNSFVCLKSDLAVMQERKPIEVKEMDYATRIREPCVYNVSERFVEKMEPIKKAHGGVSSVILSFSLPGGSSPFVMLREVFSLRYASFQDLYGML